MCPKVRPNKTKDLHCISVRKKNIVTNSIMQDVCRRPHSPHWCCVDRTGRRINDRLREHNNKVRKRGAWDGSLALHSCVFPSIIMSKSKCEIMHLLMQARHVATVGNTCVSKPSISLSNRARISSHAFKEIASSNQCGRKRAACGFLWFGFYYLHNVLVSYDIFSG